MFVLGISAFYHDSAAAIVRDGEIIAAAQEERFTRKKHDSEFPRGAVEYCLREAGCTIREVDYVAFYEKPFLKFDRLLHSYLAYAPQGLASFLKAIPIWIKDKVWMKDEIRRELNFEGPILFPDHHESHAASAFFPSPFPEAAVLTVDGVGEWTTTSAGIGTGNRLEIQQEQSFPHSLGLLYSAFTYFTGFTVNSGEYKLMGLAPYGQPTYKDLILKELIDLKEDGSFKLNMKYFNYGVGLTMTNDAFARLFGGTPRKPDTRLTQRDMDMARSVQEVTEEVMLRMAREIHRRTGRKNLCLAGGVALNCVANGRILREGPFENVWIQPAAGDAGGALGAALIAWHHYLDKPREADGVHDSQKASLLGPKFSNDEIRAFVKSKNIRCVELSDEQLADRVADLLAQEKVIGWFNGRMEFGPRALGSRSIIGDPRSQKMQATMNLKIKFRESFRPFAPCVLREHVHELFDMRANEDSPYMLLVAPVLKKHRNKMAFAEQEQLSREGDLVRWVNVPRSTLPAITHVDYSARVQTVDQRNGQFRKVMEKFYEKTGCPVVVNTSFNLSWEPIVCTPAQAYNTFMQSEMDVLVLQNFLLLKEEQPVGFQPRVESGATAAPNESPWADPKTGDPLVVTTEGAINPKTGTRYAVEENVPLLFVPTRDGDKVDVKQFYRTSPTPQYEKGADNVRALLEKSRQGMFARLLNEQIPFDARVLEVGCGTGHLTNFFAIAHRSTLGIDVCLNSLRLAENFARTHGIDHATFGQMNLFRPALKHDFFDYVISNNLLSHTEDARAAFASISRLAKPGGYVLVGLYNKFSRWLARQRQPNEKSHGMDEVFGWLRENNLEFVNAIPKPTPVTALEPDEHLFEPKDPGTRWSRLWSQIRAIPNGLRDGGSFIMIARRPLS